MRPDGENRTINSGSPSLTTAKAVADWAGVSITTVSRVLNGKVEAISASTQERVLKAAQELDYRPNALAVGLRKGTTKTVALIVPDISDAYFHLIARGVEDTAQAEGYLAIVCNTDRREEKESKYLDLLREKQVDGIIFAGGGLNDDRHLLHRKWGNAKVVTIGPHQLDAPSIRVDDQAAIAAAVRHLAEQGCTKIACIGGEPHWLVHQARLIGYQRGLNDAGLPEDPSLIWPSDFTVKSGERAVEAALKRRIHFDGIVAFDDYCAYGAMKALERSGVGVPHAVAVVGCDDIPTSCLVSPALSSIAFPLYELGSTAARLILQMVGGRPAKKHVMFPFELHVRASSARE